MIDSAGRRLRWRKKSRCQAPHGPYRPFASHATGIEGRPPALYKASNAAPSESNNYSPNHASTWRTTLRGTCFEIEIEIGRQQAARHVRTLPSSRPMPYKTDSILICVPPLDTPNQYSCLVLYRVAEHSDDGCPHRYPQCNRRNDLPQRCSGRPILHKHQNSCW